MKKYFLLLTLFLSVLLLFNCKKDDEVSIQNPDPDEQPDEIPPGEEIASERKVAIFGEVNSFLNDLNWDNRIAAHNAIVAQLKTIPEIKYAEYSAEADNVLAEFTDGSLYLVVNNRPNDQEIPLPDYTNMRKNPSNQRTESYGLPALPTSKKVYIFNGVGNYFKSSQTGNDFIKFLFQKDKEKTGYETQMVTATIKNLKEIQDAGVFYFTSHGGFGKARNSTDSVYGAWTADIADKAGEDMYRQELRKRELIYMAAYDKIVDGKKVAETHFAITSKFVNKYMKFPKYSLMYLDLCKSWEVKDFWWSFHSRSDATGTVLGWTDNVDDKDAYSTAAYFFDRLVAANTIYEVTKPENPKQRAFDLPSIFSDMADKNLGESIPYKENPSRKAYLSYHAGPNIDIFLRPSIRYMMVHEYFDWLIIWGIFGEDPGEGQRLVTIDDVPVEEVVEWDPTMVKVRIKSSGKGSAGDVIVKVRGNESLPRTLTEWRGTIKYKRPSAGSTVQEATINLHFRRDIALHREMPGEKPKKVPPSVFPYPAGDSNGSFSMSGSHKVTKSDHSCTYNYAATWTPKKGDLSLFKGDNPDVPGFILQSMEIQNGYKVDGFSLVAIPETKNLIRNDWTCVNNGSGTSGDQIKDWNFLDFPEKFKTFNLVFDSNFNIQKGSISEQMDDHSGIGYKEDEQEKYKVTLEWDAMKPNFLPKDNAAL